MLFDPNNPFDVESARSYLENCIKSGKPFNITKQRIPRTLSQNSYLHLILSYFASKYGETLEETKQARYKREVNPELFIRESIDKDTGKVSEILRSSADLDTIEMSTSIERFKNYSLMECGILLPDAEKQDQIVGAMKQIDSCKEFL